MSHRRWIAIGLLSGCAHAAPGAAPTPAPAADSTSGAPKAVPEAPLSRDARWRADLAYFARELPARHKNAFASVSPEAFARAVAQVDSAVPRLTDAQMLWRFKRLAALVRDGHTGTLYFPAFPQRLPIELLWTDAGLTVVGATEEYAVLRGRRIAALNGVPIASVADSLRPYISNDNEQGFRGLAQFIPLVPAALRDIGLGTDTTRVTLEVESAAGSREHVVVAAVPTASYHPAGGPAAPLYLQRNGEKYWLTYLPESRTAYLQYNQCRDPADFRVLVDSVSRLLDGGAKRLLVDLRHNFGGSSSVVQPLLQAVRARSAINQPGALYVAIGRVTFSSGVWAAVDFKRRTKATLIGEPTGERPNHYGEVSRFRLPNSGITITYSTKRFRIVPGDPDAVFPDVGAPPTAEAILAGRDPVMDWILRH